MLKLREQVRCRYDFAVGAYVLMPEHFHLSIGEPRIGDPSKVMFALKQPFSRSVMKKDASMKHFWQKRFYDFNVFTRAKLVEKIHYIHKNPAVRGLVKLPEDWPWSSCRYYKYEEEGTVKIDFERLVNGE